ncbi:hypothetical protein LZ578_01825 [Jeotgalibaca sp. MA1X17-3]|uniref:hypothetical protein n=1 Tax=Jeotgalibaca sp. MA1X17-3 TaxID=2908211 RepID=UPI001F2AD508|nr:hypothetical protein [Jeotgalibaca sp. MA1X17-3]UJF15910.1 hypothetical protein LZ578_01825 [Jeotgalibaca sp. MA1X17-3]
MVDSTITFIMIPIIGAMIIFGAGFIRNKFYKPKYEGKVQKPGKLEGCILKLLILVELILVGLVAVGVFAREPDIITISGVLALFILVIMMILKYATDTSYQENNEYFILKIRKKEYQVFYENIIDWRPAFKEIALLDPSRLDGKYINVNIKLFKPEILLRKLSDMTFDGKFYNPDEMYKEDPYRKNQIVNYLVNNYYGYLIEDYKKRMENTFDNERKN